MMRQDRFTEGAQEVLAASSVTSSGARGLVAGRNGGSTRTDAGPSPDSFAKLLCAARERFGAQNDTSEVTRT